jgi:hypothetical protein
MIYQDNTVDYEKRLRRGRKEYDEAYERNLHEMEHGVNCSCNRHGFPLDPPQPTWTVDGSVRPKPRKGPADPITNHGRMTWEAAQDLYDRRKI